VDEDFRASFCFCFLRSWVVRIVVLAQTQATAADLRGYVRDQQGAGVPNATVTATNPGTGLTRSVTSGGDGEYQMLNLPPGIYDLAVEATNFKKALLPAVKLTVGQAADLDVPLKLETSGPV